MTAPQQPVEEGLTGEEALLAMEATMAALVLAAYTIWLSAATAAVMAPFTLFGLAPDPSALWSTIPLWRRELDKMFSALEKIAQRGWEDASRQLGISAPFNRDDPLLQDALDRTRNLMVRTPDEVYRRIVTALGDAVGRGETVAQQAARVRQILDVTGTENWPARARTVAVTEVHRVFNFGALAASQRIQRDRNVEVRKRWVSRDDSAVRPAHVAADGQTRRVFQPFTVGGEPLMAPGDPSGSAWNVINCRCKMRFAGVNRGR